MLDCGGGGAGILPGARLMVRPDHRDAAKAEIKAALADPMHVAGLLGLDGRRDGVNLKINPCPSHGGNNACNLSRGPDGTLRVKCYGCDLSGDVFDLVAAVEGLDRRRDFARVMERAAGLAGVDLGRPTTGYTPRPRPPVVAPPPKQPLPAAELAALWAAAGPFAVTDLSPPASDMAVTWLCARRRWAPAALDELGIVRVLPLVYDWPEWWPAARAERYRIAIQAYDPATGEPRSLHARSVDPIADKADGTKTLWPWSLKGRYEVAVGLFADRAGLDVLRGTPRPDLGAILVCEGATDVIAAALAVAAGGRPWAVLGAASGGFRGLAAVRWPAGVPGVVATDDDNTGDKYAAQLAEALPGVDLRRWRPRSVGAA